MKKTYIKNNMFRYLIYSLIAVSFIAIYSTFTSPLTNIYGFDSSFFTLVGRGMKYDALPYRDFFDMKGPYLFFLEYIGQVIWEGRIGAFIIQCISLASCLCIIDSIYTSQMKIFVIDSTKNFFKLFFIGFAPILFMAALTFERGNLTEELSLSFLLLSLKLLLSYYEKIDSTGQYNHNLKYGFCYGVFFGILALIRITNAYLICAIIFTVVIELIINKKFKNLIYNGLVFIAGICVAFTPMVLYYLHKGLLLDMLYQVFAFGYVYSTDNSFLQKAVSTCSQHWSMILCMLIPVLITIIFKRNNRKYFIFSISSFIFLMIAIFMGNGYLHYFTLGLPNIVFGLYIVLTENKHIHISINKKNILAVACFSLFLLQTPKFIDLTKSCLHFCRTAKYNIGYTLVQEIKSYIPESDLDSVYVYVDSSCSAWYEMANILPPNKYCDWQNHYMMLSPEINKELLFFLENESPEWIVTSSSEQTMNSDIERIIDNEYVLYTENEAYLLYNKK